MDIHLKSRHQHLILVLFDEVVGYPLKDQGINTTEPDPTNNGEVGYPLKNQGINTWSDDRMVGVGVGYPLKNQGINTPGKLELNESQLFITKN